MTNCGVHRMTKAPSGELKRYFYENVLTYLSDECLIWPYARTSNKYAVLRLNGKQQYVHILACEEENGPKPTDKHEAAHSCGNGHLGCVARKHLVWKTSKQNHADKLLHGTLIRGEKCWNSKLSEQHVIEIRRKSREGELQDNLSREFGVTQQTISKIILKQRWSAI